MAVRVRIDLRFVHDGHGRAWTDMDGPCSSMMDMDGRSVHAVHVRPPSMFLVIHWSWSGPGLVLVWSDKENSEIDSDLEIFKTSDAGRTRSWVRTRPSLLQAS